MSDNYECTCISTTYPKERNPLPFSIDCLLGINSNDENSLIINDNSSMLVDASVALGRNERCIHGCKFRMEQFLLHERDRVQFRPLKMKGRPKTIAKFSQNYFDILVDGVVFAHLVMCKCKRLIARRPPFEPNMRAHLKTIVHMQGDPCAGIGWCFHSPQFPPIVHSIKMEPRSLIPTNPPLNENGNQEMSIPRVDPFLKVDAEVQSIIAESGIPNPSHSPHNISTFNDDESNRQSTMSDPLSNYQSMIVPDFLTRKYELESRLRLNPDNFEFQHALTIPEFLSTPPDAFREFRIPSFYTRDLILCTYCVSILNTYPNHYLNVETHIATSVHCENVGLGRGIRVKNAELKRDIDMWQ